jgi:Mitochondrial export protein Som1
MAPPIESFSSSSLRKHIPKGVDIDACPVKQLAQFECILDDNEIPICFPIVRTFKE